MAERWLPEHVAALAPDPAATAAARRLALPGRWAAAGCDDEAVWGLSQGSGAEPYQVVVELAEPAWRCTCPSRKLPCKHGIALLLLWAEGHVPPSASRPPFAGAWLARRAARAAALAAREADPGVDEPPPPEARPRPARASRSPSGAAGGTDGAADRRAAERAARVAAGLAELDRWLADCVRTGLAAPTLASYATWDRVAARLVDSQAGSLANRVRRLGGRVGTGAGWQEHVLAELGVLHLLAGAGRRRGALAADLRDGVRAAVGWSVRQDDVLATPPVTDRWAVAARSDTQEDRIVVRRTWLRGEASERWGMVLSFAAWGQTLDTTLPVGAAVVGDLHFYPSACPLRALVGALAGPTQPDAGLTLPATTLARACDEVGRALAREPWLERWPLTVRATPALDGRRWVLADHTGALSLAPSVPGLPTLVALSGGRAVDVTAEWTAEGLVPVAVHVEGRTVDLGPIGPWGRE
jgi:hypothetical protein